MFQLNNSIYWPSNHLLSPTSFVVILPLIRSSLSRSWKNIRTPSSHEDFCGLPCSESWSHYFELFPSYESLSEEFYNSCTLFHYFYSEYCISSIGRWYNPFCSSAASWPDLYIWKFSTHWLAQFQDTASSRLQGLCKYNQLSIYFWFKTGLRWADADIFTICNPNSGLNCYSYNYYLLILHFESCAPIHWYFFPLILTIAFSFHLFIPFICLDIFISQCVSFYLNAPFHLSVELVFTHFNGDPELMAWLLLFFIIFSHFFILLATLPQYRKVGLHLEHFFSHIGVL